MLLEEIKITLKYDVSKTKKEVMTILNNYKVDVQDFKACLYVLSHCPNCNILKAVYIDHVYNFNK